jgi:molybdopterin converting factor small subunit
VRVEVRLFANLREKFPRSQRGRAPIDLPDGSTVWDLVDLLEIPARQAQMVLVNGERAARRDDPAGVPELSEGDTVCVFPPLAGG